MIETTINIWRFNFIITPVFIAKVFSGLKIKKKFNEPKTMVR